MFTTQQLRWPNAERVAKSIVRGVLVDGVPVAHVGRETPIGPDVEIGDGTIRIERVGGEINRDRTLDTPQIEFASFGRTHDQAQAMSMSIERLLANGVGELVGDGDDEVCLDGFEMASGPIRPAWGRNARRDIVTWRLWWRPIVIPG